MHSNISSTPNKPRTDLLESASVSNRLATGEVEIAGRLRYGRPPRRDAGGDSPHLGPVGRRTHRPT
jgi:hypothetical protein